MQVAIAIRPLRGEKECGDAAGYWVNGTTTTLAIIDGLGHGKHAETAAKAAINYIQGHLDNDLAEIVSGCNEAIRTTRGVALGISRINELTGELSYLGVGNTRAMVVGQKTSRLSGNYGIVGDNYANLLVEKAYLCSGDLALLYTDGIKEYFDLSAFGETPAVDLDSLTSWIIENWALERDDAAALIYRKESL
ncbi:MAG: SpoIIE family protein phosphatase [Syntrophobacteraceae bacterium]